MNDVRKLSEDEVEDQLAILNQALTAAWQVRQGKLHKEFVFPDFAAAMAFMQTAAEVAEKMDHHPEWCNIYNKVTVDLTTHIVGGISSLDFELAKNMEKACQ